MPCASRLTSESGLTALWPVLAGLLCTRTLYDKEMLQAIRMSNGLGGRADPLVSENARSDATQEPAADAKLQRRQYSRTLVC